MKKRNIVLMAVSAVTIGTLVATLMPATGQVTGKNFTLCEKDTHDYEKDVDNGAKGFSAGDQFIFSEPEFDTNGERVGKIFGTGTVLKRLKQDGIIQFSVSFNLHGGSIELQATSKFSNLGGGSPVAIVGGTGKYNDASGVAKIYTTGCKGVKDSKDRAEFFLN
jgi:hypothetical protein